MVTFAAIRASCSTVFTTSQSTDALVGGMPFAADTTEIAIPAVLLDMPEGLTLEAPQGLTGEYPDGVLAPRA